MTLMDQTQGSDMERLWALLSELSAQLSHNRQQTEELHRRADELKVRAVTLGPRVWMVLLAAVVSRAATV